MTDSPAARIGIVLGGASCTGKSVLLARLQESQAELRCHEMDRCQYWDEAQRRRQLPEAEVWLTQEIASEALRSDVLASPPKVRIAKIALLRLVVAQAPFVTTSGPLPGRQDPFYELIGAELGWRIAHVLVDPSPLTHTLRILKRFRLRRLREFRRTQEQKAADVWDARVSDVAGLRKCITEMCA